MYKSILYTYSNQVNMSVNLSGNQGSDNKIVIKLI